MTIKKILKYSDIRVNDIVTGGRIVTEVKVLDSLVQITYNDGSHDLKHHLMQTEIER